MWLTKENRWYTQYGAMSSRASDAIRAGKTRQEYVDLMLAMRPRLKRDVWTPRLESVYDASLRWFNEPRGACYICGTEMTGKNYGGSYGKQGFCKSRNCARIQAHDFFKKDDLSYGDGPCDCSRCEARKVGAQ